MMKLITTMITIIIVVIFYTSIFIVKEGERGIILRFGRILHDDKNQSLICNPGLHFKIPLIESVRILDSRIQTMNNNSDRFVTKEKKDLIIDSYIKWRINDFSRYYLATGGNLSQAEILLKRKCSDRMRSTISDLSIKEIVTDSHDHLTLKICNVLNFGDNENEKEKRNIAILNNTNRNSISKYFQKININKKKAPIFNANSMIAIGIEVIDVRIKKINLPKEISEAIYNRMKAKCEEIARQYRSKGQEEAEKLRAAADYKAITTLAEAERQGRILRGEGDVEAAKLFVDAFSDNPSFYAFIRTLLAYENSFQNNQDFMILNSNSDFFRYMKGSNENTY